MNHPEPPESASQAPSDAPTRARPRPGERRLQILQTLASMLEQSGADRVTTAALAARVGVSEAALYRHFASKAQMLEGLIDYAEQASMGLLRQVSDRDPAGPEQVAKMVDLLLQFAQQNPGLCRVMTGDALGGEHARLHARVQLLLDKIEAQWRQSLREGATLGVVVDAPVLASVAMSFWLGRVQRFVRSGFTRSPTEHLPASLRVLFAPRGD